MDTTVTKFLNDDNGDISVTKFLDQRSNDVTVTKFLEAPEDSIAVTKYLSGTPTYNTYPGSSDGKDKNNVNMTIIQFLEDYLHEHPDHMLHDPVANGDISVTKFLQQNANVTQKEQNGQRMNII